ncbi:alkylresorcinol/alkylpyrone synthase [Evansella caseinilytica]|uniref:Alkylresorcinol/alkylpyrone synthase n=1 Tax=Evansella caseinilytica TaxID=1503961 RepID=A0A1H3TQA4_9BACI|nr:3-oxoacyl-[acyl-carrier-protein] synthase III C-terminal domain-containing protein [Evansella caseinilytica]SDZ52001.1 alkylresorcinol/alkylpyrone synthase [Evansella caseinilytica]
MPAIVSVQRCIPKYQMEQQETEEIVRELFAEAFPDIDRLLRIFRNGQIEKRHFVVPKEWFQEEHSFEAKNQLYMKEAVSLGTKAVQRCLNNRAHLMRPIKPEEVDAIFFVSSTGLATPSIEARIMNLLPFSPHTKRIPLWGLGCAGGGAGISRAYEYCLAFPDAKVLVLCIELCSLTFQHKDTSKSNLVGTSLFADGVACALVVGDDVVKKSDTVTTGAVPFITGTQTTLMPRSEDVMGWEVKNSGLHVIFSRDIPSIIDQWLKPNVDSFLQKHGYALKDITHFVAHPGGKKVIDAYEAGLSLPEGLTMFSKNVLKQFGNMSSPTVLYVLQETMSAVPAEGSIGLMTALGPGFSSELVLLHWREAN